jgi:hypothetical protein
MKTLYADHMVLVRPAQRTELSKLLNTSTDLRFAASIWNLYEISLATDRAQVVRLAEFIDQHRPLWISNLIDIQKLEIRRFLWLRYFEVSADSIGAFSDHLSVVSAGLVGSRTRLGYTAVGWVKDNWGKIDLKAARQETVSAMVTLQNTTQRRRKEAESETFREWLRARLPVRDPEEIPLRPARRQAILDFCWAERQKLYQDCPAIQVEDALFKIRTLNPKRVPRESDAADLQHSVVALAYCDFFVTGDGFVRRCAEIVRERLLPLHVAETFKAIAALSSAIRSPLAR